MGKVKLIAGVVAGLGVLAVLVFAVPLVRMGLECDVVSECRRDPESLTCLPDVCFDSRRTVTLFEALTDQYPDSRYHWYGEGADE
ncbi:hypothetical protein FWD07_01205 [Candidatus Saccharibacteria bacterium]|nr:hypothetical protein [Candidatus Saccharibacteria bacterium]